MNIEHLKASGIDYDDGLKRFSGNEKIYSKYLFRLVDLDIYHDFKKSVEDNDTQSAFEAAHKLKAFIGNLSIPQLYEIISEVTEGLRVGNIDSSKEAMPQIDALFLKVISAIKEEMNE